MTHPVLRSTHWLRHRRATVGFNNASLTSGIIVTELYRVQWIIVQPLHRTNEVVYSMVVFRLHNYINTRTPGVSDSGSQQNMDGSKGGSPPNPFKSLLPLISPSKYSVKMVACMHAWCNDCILVSRHCFVLHLLMPILNFTLF